MVAVQIVDAILCSGRDGLVAVVCEFVETVVHISEFVVDAVGVLTGFRWQWWTSHFCLLVVNSQEMFDDTYIIDRLEPEEVAAARNIEAASEFGIVR